MRRPMYYIYSGYVTSDSYDASETPVYTMRVCSSADEVTQLKEDFENDLSEDCSNIIFRVIEGRERKLVEETKVVTWKLADINPLL